MQLSASGRRHFKIKDDLQRHGSFYLHVEQAFSEIGRSPEPSSSTVDRSRITVSCSDFLMNSKARIPRGLGAHFKGRNVINARKPPKLNFLRPTIFAPNKHAQAFSRADLSILRPSLISPADGIARVHEICSKQASYSCIMYVVSTADSCNRAAFSMSRAPSFPARNRHIPSMHAQAQRQA